MLWNVEGFESLRRSCAEYDILQGAEIAVITESLIVDSSYSLNGYYTFVTDTPRAVMGAGIAIFVKPQHNPRLISKSTHHLTVQCTGFDIVACYFPPGLPVEEVVMETITALATIQKPQSTTILLGDFNCRTDQGDRGTILSEAIREQAHLDLQNDPRAPTFMGPTGNSTIDLVFSNTPPLSIKNVQSIERRHLQVWSTWDLGGEEEETEEPSIKREVDLDILIANPLLDQVPLLLEEGDVTGGAEILSEIVLDAAPAVPPKKKTSKPWFDHECALLKRATMDSRRQTDYWQHRRRYKNTCKEKRVEYEQQLLNKRIDNIEVKAWELFNKKRKTIAPVPLDDWETHFATLLDPQKEAPACQLPPNQEALEQRDEWYNRPFSDEEVNTGIQHLKNKKAAGPDRLANEHLKASAAAILGLWTLLINTCLRFGTVSSRWRESKIIVLYKGKGSTAEPGNYRGIALLSTYLANALRQVDDIQFILYADDLVIYASSPEPIQQALRVLEDWCERNRLKVNTRKTMVMKFRKAGRLARNDQFFFNGEQLTMCSTYDYLGVTFQPSLTFSKHLLRRKASALAATGSLKHLHLVSIPTALKIFQMKIKPMATYGFDSIAPYMNAQQLIEIDRVKTIFLKKALRISRRESATLALHLCDTTTLAIDLKEQDGIKFNEETWNDHMEKLITVKEGLIIDGDEESCHASAQTLEHPCDAVSLFTAEMYSSTEEIVIRHDCTPPPPPNPF
ncbi:unnamed protein product [Cyprideis torosa]|uniref:Uncharacterized protein n=1 Tax=Cyprideis torosa TaxID=163714 RepID=A0A7R8ZGT4_9CRUS|nr:unnamed protein product [Cyprideis torosa]CAG0882141.1 unnamed protein product [Cyprideis torosa]